MFVCRGCNKELSSKRNLAVHVEKCQKYIDQNDENDNNNAINELNQQIITLTEELNIMTQTLQTKDTQLYNKNIELATMELRLKLECDNKLLHQQIEHNKAIANLNIEHHKIISDIKIEYEKKNSANQNELHIKTLDTMNSFIASHTKKNIEEKPTEKLHNFLTKENYAPNVLVQLSKEELSKFDYITKLTNDEIHYIYRCENPVNKLVCDVKDIIVKHYKSNDISKQSFFRAPTERIKYIIYVEKTIGGKNHWRTDYNNTFMMTYVIEPILSYIKSRIELINTGIFVANKVMYEEEKLVKERQIFAELEHYESNINRKHKYCEFVQNEIQKILNEPRKFNIDNLINAAKNRISTIQMTISGIRAINNDGAKYDSVRKNLLDYINSKRLHHKILKKIASEFIFDTSLYSKN